MQKCRLGFCYRICLGLCCRVRARDHTGYHQKNMDKALPSTDAYGTLGDNRKEHGNYRDYRGYRSHIGITGYILELY